MGDEGGLGAYSLSPSLNPSDLGVTSGEEGGEADSEYSRLTGILVEQPKSSVRV